jgi:DUF1365 family protein
MSLLIDLDRLEVAGRQSLLFGVNWPALYSFHEADRGDHDGSSLRLYAPRYAAEHGTDLAGGRVLLLCYPRLLGYAFNPLSVYFCYHANRELAVLIYEVRNTFGGIHAYVPPVKRGDVSPAGIRQAQDKRFTSRPLSGWPRGITSALCRRRTTSNYAFSRPTTKARFWPATFSGRRRILTTGELLRSFFSPPLITLKVFVAIHWEALRLWLKGVRLVPAPDKTADGGLATEARSDYTSNMMSAHRRQ